MLKLNQLALCSMLILSGLSACGGGSSDSGSGSTRGSSVGDNNEDTQNILGVYSNDSALAVVSDNRLDLDLDGCHFSFISFDLDINIFTHDCDIDYGYSAQLIFDEESLTIVFIDPVRVVELYR